MDFIVYFCDSKLVIFYYPLIISFIPNSIRTSKALTTNKNYVNQILKNIAFYAYSPPIFSKFCYLPYDPYLKN